MTDKNCENCANWEAKEPEGPFTTYEEHGTWYIHHLPDHSLPIKVPSESEAKIGANWLNKHWAKKEAE